MKLSISLAAALLTTVAVSSCSGNGQAGSQVINDTNTPLHLLQPDYKIPYGVPAKEDIKAELKEEGKPEKIWDRIIPGKMQRFIDDNTQVDKQFAVLSQDYIMDDSKTVGEFLKDKGAKLVSFTRYEVGEGIEKKQEDFAAEVREQMKQF